MARRKKDLAQGSAFTLLKSPTIDFFSKISDLGAINAGGYVTTNENIHKIMEVSNKLYVWDGICACVVDAMTDMSTTTVDIISSDANSKDVFLYWLRNVNMLNSSMRRGAKEILRHEIFELIVSGNAILVHEWQNVKINGKGKTYNLPMVISFVDPMLIDIKYNSYLNQKEMIFNLDRIDTSDVTGETNKSKFLKKNKAGDLILNPESSIHLKMRGKSYQHVGIPFLHRAFLPIRKKLHLYNLDMSTIDGIMSAIMLFKIGSDKFPASQERLQSFATLLNGKRSANLVWTHDISAETAGPDNEILKLDKKYDDVNTEIFRSLGFSPLFLDGSGDGSNAWLMSMPLIHRLVAFQECAKEFFEIIAEQMVLRNKGLEYDSIVIKAPTFTNETLVKALVMGLYDRGMLSMATALNICGFDINVEKTNRESEVDLKEIFTIPDLPFSKTDGGNGSTTSNDEESGGATSKYEDQNTKSKNGISGKGKSNSRKSGADFLIETAKACAGMRMDSSVFQKVMTELCGNVMHNKSNKLITITDRDKEIAKEMSEDLVDMNSFVKKYVL